MKYFISIDGREIEVEVDGKNLTVAGRPVVASIEQSLHSPELRVSIDGRSYRLAAAGRDEEGWLLLDQGALRTVPAVDERTRHIRSLTAKSSGAATGGTVKAPMPGLVVKVLVESGQSVQKGDGLLVLEAMKMENEIAAPADGVVDSIGVKAGTAVEKGAELARISPSPQESS